MAYVIVHPANIEVYWPIAAPWIAQAIGESDTWKDLDDIKKQIKENISTLWIGRNPDGSVYAVLVTETWYMAGRKVLVLRWLCGCDFEEIKDDFFLIENFAQNNGFQDIHIWGRKGFEKVCKPLGFEHAFTVLSKPVMRGLH